MNRADTFNGGFNARSAFASTGTALAGGAGDNTEVDGVYVNRKDDKSGIAMSAKLVIAYRATLAAGATLSLTVNIQDDADGAGAGVDYGPAYPKTVVATGGAGGTTESGTIELDFDLAAAEQYVRSQITPDLSAGATDTATVTAVWVFFGAQKGPMSKSVV